MLSLPPLPIESLRKPACRQAGMRNMLILERDAGDRHGQLQAALYQSNSRTISVSGAEQKNVRSYFL